MRTPGRTIGRMIAIVGFASAAAGCGSASDSTAGTRVTVEPAATPEAMTTTIASPAVESGDWAPACSNLDLQHVSTLPNNPAGLDDFGPLGATASIVIEVPSGWSADGTRAMPPAVSTNRIPGGLLLLVNGSSQGAATSSILAAIDHTGAKRWVRCIGVRVDDVQINLDADVAYLGFGSATNASEGRAVEVELADGTVSATDPRPVTVAEELPVEWQGIHVVADIEGLSGLAADGTVAWSRDDLALTSLEGSRIATDDDVMVVTACTTPIGPDGWCSPAVIGLETTTGATLWTLDGFRSIAHVDDGSLLASSGPLFDDDHNFQAQGWTLFDDRTGKPRAGQSWEDPAAFETACCADGEYIHTLRHGGIVVAIAETTVSVWYPEALSATTQHVTIP